MIKKLKINIQRDIIKTEKGKFYNLNEENRYLKQVLNDRNNEILLLKDLIKKLEKDIDDFN